MKSKCVCKAEPSSLDIICTLPQTILETILCLLSTKQAARTSILSREWRYKWTTIPKLQFELSQVQGKNMDTSCKPFYDLHQILLLHRGPIQEFSLDMDGLKPDQDSSGFDEIVLHLAKNHSVKKLSLFGPDEPSWDYNLPISVFSLHHLTDLYISSCDLDHQPIFNGFGSLRSLDLRHVGISTKTLLHLLSNCPLLKSLDLHIGESHIGDEDCTIIELFKCLRVIEHLTIYNHALSQWLVLDSVPKVLPTTLFHLKYFCFEDMCFVDGYGLPFLLTLIKCSPNLEKIKLEMRWDHECDDEFSIVWGKYADVWLEHLSELKIECFINLKHEMAFVKFILARSPNLKKVRVKHNALSRRKKLKMLKILSQAPHVSPVVITVK